MSVPVEQVIDALAARRSRAPVRLDGIAAPLVGIAGLAAMFLSVALWNGFPLTFYDTGGYLVQGLAGAFLPERSQVYSLLLVLMGAAYSLWLVAIAQSVVAAFLITELARAEVPDLTLPGLLGIGAGLCLLTGIVWYTGQVEPDIMTPLLVLGCYLLMFRAERMGRGPRAAVFVLTALAIGSHPSHLGLIAGLLICGAVLALARRFMPALPQPRLAGPLGSFALALLLIVGANYGYTGEVFLNRSGSAFLFGRVMQDGLVKRVLDDTCPQSGYRLCALRDRLRGTTDGWLWSSNSGFRALGGFNNRALEAEYGRIIGESLRRYPWSHLRAAVYDSVLQVLRFRTGDGIEPQMAVIEAPLREVIPGQVPAYLAARQQRGELGFRSLNLVHVPVGVLSLLGLFLLLGNAARRGWRDAPLPAMVLLGLVGNAIICGTFDGPHNRYQSRLMWLPVLVVILARIRDPDALHSVSESVT